MTGGLRWGIEPICHVLEIVPSTYWSAKRRPPSARSISDAELKPKIRTAFAENYSVYGPGRYGRPWAAKASSWAGTGWPG